MRQRKFAPVDVLRFLASVNVLLNHLVIVWEGRAPTGALGWAFRAAFGWMTFFFVLSGFVIGHAYLAPASRFDLRDFVAARASRIVPLHLLTLLILAVPAFALGFGRLDALAAHATLLHAWFPRYLHAFNIPSWTLSVEVLCYAVFALVLVRVVPRLGARGLVGLVAACFVLLMAASGVYAVVDPDGHGLEGPLDERGHWWWSALIHSPILHGAEFVIGVAVARLNALTSGERRWTSWLFVASAAWFAALVAFAPMMLLHNGAALPAVVMFVWASADNDHWLVRSTSTRLTEMLGKYSFGVYMLHFPMLHLVAGVRPSVPAGVAFLLAVLVAAAVVHHLVEDPVQRWGRRRFGRRSAAPVEAPAPAPAVQVGDVS